MIIFLVAHASYSTPRYGINGISIQVKRMHILFVCTGNTCRSPMAEAYFRNLIEKNDIKDITVSSAGTYAGNGEVASPFAIKTLQNAI